MEPGKIYLLNSGTGPGPGFTQTICYSSYNRLYRITNDGHGSEGEFGPGIMTIRVGRSVWWGTTTSFYELYAGRSLDVYGASITVEALQDLRLVGTFDTI